MNDINTLINVLKKSTDPKFRQLAVDLGKELEREDKAEDQLHAEIMEDIHYNDRYGG